MRQHLKVINLKYDHSSHVVYNRELPYTTADNQLTVSLSEGIFHLDLVGGLVKVTFDLGNDVYIIQMSRELNNASLGLLGKQCPQTFNKFCGYLEVFVFFSILTRLTALCSLQKLSTSLKVKLFK